MTRTAPASTLLCALGGLFVSVACQDAPTHPPFIDRCPEQGSCRPIVGVRQRPSTGGGDNPDRPPPGSSDGPDVITGTVSELVDDLFLSSITFPGRAEIRAEGDKSNLVRAEYTGLSAFVLSEFAVEDPLWLLVKPEENPSVLPTLSPIPLSAAFRPVELGLVRQENVDVVFRLASVFSERVLGTAQLILVFTDAEDGSGVPGVSVRLPGAELVSYANGGAWSDIETATDNTGVVMLGNIWASEFPGGDVRVHLSGTTTGSIDVRLARDVVTLAEVPLE